MKSKLNLFILLSGIILFAASCKPKNAADENLAPNVHKVTAEEVIQTSNYSYVRISENGNENWIAITRQEVEKGKSYYYIPGIEMSNFVSKELKRTFPSILFVDKFSDQPIRAKINVADSAKGKQSAVQKEGIKVEPAKGGITIAELYANKDKYAGKIVKIRGEVVKYNAQIMNTNWVHIQDGTNNDGSFDLTITTNDETKVGDVVTFEGTVTLKKDFGAGYFYEVIVENAKLLTNM
ncbi:MAG: GW dipeptide domain-containing protein [Bacteroidales bacterium]|nr:GW dipeptide domain-containing protein [Bacteroidales bacterium]